jgi:hypothetical protein
MMGFVKKIWKYMNKKQKMHVGFGPARREVISLILYLEVLIQV